jgi:hypothetical protein
VFLLAVGSQVDDGKAEYFPEFKAGFICHLS